MSAAKDDGGPAFPSHPAMAERFGLAPSFDEFGMALRDYFAAKVMQAHLTAQWQSFYRRADDDKKQTHLTYLSTKT